MRNGWTGGAYSLVRAMIGLRALWLVIAALLAGDASLHPGVAVALVAAAIQMIIGWGDRLGALMIALVFLVSLEDPFVGVLAILHLTLPPKPYGSLTARGRPDPGGGWSWPRRHRAAWFWIGLSFGGCALYYFAMGWGFSLGVGWTSPLILLLTWFDPGWIPPARAEEREHIFYDGHCGLCHRSIRFLLAEDRHDSFVFAPLGSETFSEPVPEDKTANLPDSVVVRTHTGELLVRSNATVHALKRLGGIWRIFGTAIGIVPRALRDSAYNFIAAIRYRVWGQTPDACPIIPNRLRDRFRA